MKKVVRTFILVLLVILLCLSTLLSASAENVADKGFVEFQTQASINFEEIIEVILTDNNSGHYYTQRLYRINDYSANISLPVGNYSVSAQVLDASEQVLPQYNILFLSEDIEVTSALVAEVVSLEVQEFAVGDVSTEPQDGAGATDFTLVTEDDTCPEPGDASEKEGKPGRSILTSVFVTFVAFVIGALVFYFVKKKQES